MTPYRINTTWVDLDHVLAIEEKVRGCGTYPTYTPMQGRLTLAFYNGQFVVDLSAMSITGGEAQRTTEEGQAMWDAFIAAWKAGRQTEARKF